jgi:HSP20 family protein
VEPAGGDETLYYRTSQLMRAAWGDGWRPFDPLAPLADPRETDDAYVVEIDLPGVKKDALSVELSGNELVVTGGSEGRRGWPVHPPDPAQWAHRAAGATARLGRGGQGDRLAVRRVLTVTVPKSEDEKAYRVEVTSA